ncbi:MAG: hypothetical protein AAFW68_01160 [Pseudomonadota bacterium]
MVRTIIAYLLSTAATYVVATAFYTQQVIAKQAAIGAVYLPSQQFSTLIQNLTGLWIYGAMIAIALVVGFGVAFFVKRLLQPLAPIAYPTAGAAAMLGMILLIEQQLGGGAGIIGGARDALGLTLQCIAGFIGGAVFATMRSR